MKKIFKNQEGKQSPYNNRVYTGRDSSWAGKKITVMGLGLIGGGVGVSKFFCRQGAKVLVTDLKNRKQLKESILKLRGFPIKYVLGRHREKDFINADLIIKNPAAPKDSYFLEVARKHNTPVETDVTVFFRLCRAPIIGVTGTKGKSTVATLIYLFLKSKYPDTILAGNIGLSPLEALSKITKKSRVVLELSSFELEDLKKSPPIAVITTIFKDHLNRYKNFKEYVDAKKTIFQYQKKDDILVLNYDNRETRKFSYASPSLIYFYSQKSLPEGKKTKMFAGFLKKEQIFFDEEKTPVCQLKEIKISGEHNISNILAAVSIAKILKIPSENIKKVLRKFKGLPYRQEFVREIKGVKYFNDTTATMPEAAIVAINNFSERFPNSNIILIAGGQDKNLNYKNLAKDIQKKVSCLILLPGTASDKIKKEISLTKNKKVKIFFAISMKEAVKKSFNIAKKDDIVLLSPGAASFTPLEDIKTKRKSRENKSLTGLNLFKNEFDRGEQFKRNVKAL